MSGVGTVGTNVGGVVPVVTPLLGSGEPVASQCVCAKDIVSFPPAAGNAPWSIGVVMGITGVARVGNPLVFNGMVIGGYYFFSGPDAMTTSWIMWSSWTGVSIGVGGTTKGRCGVLPGVVPL